jgi:hypothetical protein
MFQRIKLPIAAVILLLAVIIPAALYMRTIPPKEAASSDASTKDVTVNGSSSSETPTAVQASEASPQPEPTASAAPVSVVSVVNPPPIEKYSDVKSFALKVRYVTGTGAEQTVSWKYLALDNGKVLHPTADSIEDAAVFDVHTGFDAEIEKSGAVSRETGLMLCAETGSFIANRPIAVPPAKWEWMTTEITSDGSIALVATGADHGSWGRGKYVYATSNSPDANISGNFADLSNPNRRVEMEVIEYARPEVPAASVTLNETARTITEFEGTVQLTASGYAPENASNIFVASQVSWSSSDITVATVDKSGLVTGIGRGTAVITAEADGVVGSCEVTVDIIEVPPEGVAVTPGKRSLPVGLTAALNAEIFPPDTTSRKITWATSDAAIATVDDSGVVTAISQGGVTITASTSNGITAECALTVTKLSDGKPAVFTSALGSDDVIVYIKNVLDFGASPDGVSDNTAVFQAAIEAAEDAGGGVVFAPAGVYRFDGRLTIPSGVTLRGEWLSPLKGGGKGEGTVLAVYGGRGATNIYQYPTDEDRRDTGALSFIGLDSSATVEYISFWYPEQDIENIVEYPFTIGDDNTGGNDVINVINVTLYNSYAGLMSYGNHGCTTFRNVFGTVLSVGISEDCGFDVGRIENIYFGPEYWAGSGLPGAPSADSVSAYTRANAVGVDMFQDDWGIMYNLDLNHLRVGLQMNDGNCAVSHLKTRNVDIAINMRSISYPGFQLTHSDLEASDICINYDVITDAIGNARTRSNGSNKTGMSQGTEQVAVNGVRFGGNPETAVVMNRRGALASPVLSMHNCTFDNWQGYAIDAVKGSVILMANTFNQTGRAVKLDAQINAANVLGNNFNDYAEGVSIENAMASNFNINNDPVEGLPTLPDYEYEFAPVFKPASPESFYNAADHGVTANGLSNDKTDQTSTLQALLDKAASDGGGTVFLPGGTYWLAGNITIPTGVELRGTFDASHTGKHQSTAAKSIGTVIVVYGDSANARMAGTATINVSADASVRGLTFYYPDQRIITADEPAGTLYPWAVRGLGDRCSITNVTLVNAYNGFDLMTYGCDGAVLADTNAYALGTQVQAGGGMDGGWIQDVHFNQCNWQQSNWPTNDEAVSGGDNSLMNQYAEKYITGFKYGAMNDVYNFQNFTITVDRAIWMVEEEEGVFNGTFNGFAFDSNRTGLEIENAGTVTFINAMCVTNLPRAGNASGGPNIRAKDTFTGTLYYFNGDSWGHGTRPAEVHGGTVYLVQYNSWCSPLTVVDGGALHIYGSQYMHQGGIPGMDVVVNEGAAKVTFVGNIGRNKLTVINNAEGNVTARYNLRTDKTAVPDIEK